MEEYDPVGNTWTQKNPLPINISFMSTGVLNNKITFTGGFYAYSNDMITNTTIYASSLIYEYASDSDTWLNKGPMCEISGMSGFTDDGAGMYIFGGFNRANPFTPLNLSFYYKP